MPSWYSILSLAGLALLPVIFSWLIVVIPSRRREASGLRVGNPLLSAPVAEVQPLVTKPLVAISRHLSRADMSGFILGLRHLPVQQTAPILSRYVRCDDPALQLYAQSLLAQGVEKLQARMTKLRQAPPADARAAAWLLETGLALAHPALAGAGGRAAQLQELAAIAREKLVVCEPSPALLAAAVEVFLESGHAREAAQFLGDLPPGSPLRVRLERELGHVLRLPLALTT